jgi:hypothetical protein
MTGDLLVIIFVFGVIFALLAFVIYSGRKTPGGVVSDYQRYDALKMQNRGNTALDSLERAAEEAARKAKDQP